MSEQVTEEQLAQCFLSANCLHLIRGANRDQQDGQESLRIGPPVVALKRVKGSERSLHEGGFGSGAPQERIDPPAYGVYGTIESKYSSITNLADMFSIEEEQGALSMAANMKGHLKPDFAFFKLYPWTNPDPDGEPWYKIRMRPEEFPYQEEAADQDHEGSSKIKFSKIEWQQLGGNPAEIDSNIAFKITLSTRDLSNFFTPWVPGQRKAGLRSSMANDSDLPQEVREIYHETSGVGVRWIDLIQVTSGRGCLDRYKPSRIRLQVGYKWDNETKTEARKTLNAALNPDPETGILPLVSIGGKTGEELVNAHLEEFEAMVKSQTKSYDLSLMRHELKYEGSGPAARTVTLDISYIASIEQSQRNTQSDLFHDYGLRKYADIKKAELAHLNHQLGAIQPIHADPTRPVDSQGVPGLTAEQQSKNERRESCRAELETTIKEIQQQIANANVRAKKRLLNQLLLGAAYTRQGDVTLSQATGERNVSRVYWTIIHEDALMSTLPFTQAATPEQNMIPVYNYASLMKSGFLEDHTRNDSDQRFSERTDERTERELLELYGQDVSDLPNPGGSQFGQAAAPVITTGETGVATSHTRPSLRHAGNPKKLIKFIFFGDIIEAALEIVAQNLYIDENHRLKDRLENRAKIAANSDEPPESGKYSWSHIDYTYVPTFFAGAQGRFNEVGPEPQSSAVTTSTRPPAPDFPTGLFGLTNTSIEGVAAYNRAAAARDRAATEVGFSTEARWTAKGGHTEREIIVKSMLGDFITGDITMPKPNIGGELAGPRGKRTINIADIPISWDFFRQWWMNVAISRAGQTTLYFREFLIKLITDLLPRAIGRGCAWIADGEKTPQILLNNYSVTGRDVIHQAHYSPAWRDHSIGQSPHPLLGRYIIGEEIQEILTSWSDMSTALPTTPITAISMKDTGAFVGTGDPLKDLEYNRAHINPVGENSAVVIALEFIKEDLPYIREANMDAGTLGIIREKYNCNVTAIGNTMYKPGGIFYINPETLALGKNTKAYGGGSEEPATPDRFAMPTLPDGTADKTPYARLLGLGGYYVITRITHVMEFTGATGEWLTTFQAKWLAFANENDPCAEEQPEDGFGKNSTDEDLDCPDARGSQGGAPVL